LNIACNGSISLEAGKAEAVLVGTGCMNCDRDAVFDRDLNLAAFCDLAPPEAVILLAISNFCNKSFRS